MEDADEGDRVDRTALAELAAWVDARLPRLIDDAFTAVLDRMEVYRRGEPVPREDLRGSVAHNLRFIVAAIGDPDAARDLAAPRETGRRRAHQGMPLPEVLRAYRISFGTLWDALVDHVRHGAQPVGEDALLTAASMIWQLTDEHALALTEAYRAATAELLLAQQQRRSALVEALLSGHPGPDAGPWEAAALLGLPPDGQLVVVAADTRGLAEESLPAIERRLADRGIVTGWRQTPALQLGIVSLRPAQREVPHRCPGHPIHQPRRLLSNDPGPLLPGEDFQLPAERAPRAGHASDYNGGPAGAAPCRLGVAQWRTRTRRHDR